MVTFDQYAFSMIFSLSDDYGKSSIQKDQIHGLENDSDYEDLDDDEATVLTSMLDRDLLKVSITHWSYFRLCPIVGDHRTRLSYQTSIKTYQTSEY